jgi:hypothetical protein
MQLGTYLLDQGLHINPFQAFTRPFNQGMGFALALLQRIRRDCRGIRHRFKGGLRLTLASVFFPIKHIGPGDGIQALPHQRQLSQILYIFNRYRSAFRITLKQTGFYIAHTH